MGPLLTLIGHFPCFNAWHPMLMKSLSLRFPNGISNSPRFDQVDRAFSGRVEPRQHAKPNGTSTPPTCSEYTQLDPS